MAKTISVVLSNGQTLDASFSPLLVTTGAGIAATTGGSAVDLTSGGIVTNDGTLVSNLLAGVQLDDASTVNNGSDTFTTATIAGSVAGVISLFGTTTVYDGGTIFATQGPAVYIQSGAVYVGSVGNTTASVIGANIGIGVAAGAATVVNRGTVAGLSNAAVYGLEGGSIANGAENATHALMIGGINGAGLKGVGQIQNYGTLAGLAQNGVTLEAGGVVDNGSTADTSALIFGGAIAVVATGGSGSVYNDGTIASSFTGISLQKGGSVNNGQVGDTTATVIAGSNGIVVNSDGKTGAAHTASTVMNLGTILAGAQISLSGVVLNDNGTITNGSEAITTALIQEKGSGFPQDGQGNGVLATVDGATVSNLGTISGSVTGIYLSGNVAVYNGNLADKTATVRGGLNGVKATVFESNIVNDGTILGNQGVELVGGVLRNGSAADTTAVIQGTSNGSNGIQSTAGTLTLNNFGTITGDTGVNLTGVDADNNPIYGTGTIYSAGVIASAQGATGTAIQFGAGNDALHLIAGDKIVGIVDGGAGGNLLGLGTGGSGSGQVGGIGTQFIHFDTYAVDPGATWQFFGVNTFAAGSTLHNDGTIALADQATIDIEGHLNIDQGNIDNDGNGNLRWGMFDFGTGGASTLILGTNATLNTSTSQTLNSALRNLHVGDVVKIEAVSQFTSVLFGNNSDGSTKVTYTESNGHSFVINSLTVQSGDALSYAYDAASSTETISVVGAAAGAAGASRCRCGAGPS